jgi:predicted O-methyltransferase YrrM
MIDKLINKTLLGNGDSDSHLLTLFSLALTTKGKTFIELGVRGGTTTEPLLNAAKLTGAKLYSVDINETSYKPIKELENHWEFVKKDSIEFLSNWDSNNNIDIVYIDDWHSYEHVKKELEILDTIVSPKTIILLHDLMYGETCPFYHTDLLVKDGQWGNGGPYRAVAELNPQFWEFSTIPYNNGLTILRKKYSSKYKNK